MLSSKPEFKRRPTYGSGGSFARLQSRQAYSYRSTGRGARQAGSFFQFIILSAVLLAGSGLVLKLLDDGRKTFIATNAEIIRITESTPLILRPEIDVARLDKEIKNLIAEHPELAISVSYKDLTTGKMFHYGVDNAFVAASVPKLLTAALYLKQVDEGKRSLNDTVGGATARQQLRSLIVISDNAAWVALDRLLVGKNLEAFAKDLGLQRYNNAQNSLTSNDIALLLQKIYRGKLLSKESTDLLLSYMEEANYRQYIVAALPTDVKSYHKVGFLEDRIHDVAIVDNGRFPYLLAIFTEGKSGAYDFVEGTALVRDITKSVHTSYEPK